ncbi:hypothetical protein IscW_ISCW014910 [Ixodes scapularis]|uniref:Uncharacterized protein n=1 Tax=Ixodes scapularis TaxID=6945 RepID=B7QGQ1_IXOSC|nr:hypothetical protein IscW_ISCW014910 [Ixodes scapularis]|eukprot:XP_002400420.1 hypothetical protein IscW_ISCW014910 [Ixodes scapularis]
MYDPSRQEGHTCLIDPTHDEETAPVEERNLELSFGRMTLGFMPALQQVAALVQDGDLDAASVVAVYIVSQKHLN